MRERSRTIRTGVAAALVALLVTALPALGAPRDNDLEEACENAPETTFADESSLNGEEEIATDCLAADGWDGIVKGYGDGTYRPRVDVRREQMAAFIARLLVATGVTLPAEPADAFDDDDASPFHKEINQLADLGVVSGRPDSNDQDGDGDTDELLFFPQADVRRDQMAKFIANAIEATSGEDLTASGDPFPDEDCDASLEGDVNALAEANIVKGTADGDYDCDVDVTRGQMSLFLARTLDWLVHNGYENNPFLPPNAQTDAPELLSVQFVNEGSDFVNVRFTFDEDVSGKSPAAGCFHLYSFDLASFASGSQGTCATGHPGDQNADAASADGTDAFVETSNTTSVIVKFAITPAEFDLVTTATVDFDAVQDVAGTENPEGSAPVQAVTIPAGETSAPDLVSLANFDATADTVEFVFDEAVAAVLSQTAFVLVEIDGQVKRSDAAAIKSGDPKRVVATFNDAGNDDEAAEEPGIATGQQAATARAAVEAGAVSDTAQDGNATNGAEGDLNVLQVVVISNNGFTDEPELTKVTIDAKNTRVLYEFDVPIQLAGSTACDDTLPGAPVSENDGLCFQVYDRNADTIEADSAVRSSDSNRVVIATFGAGELEEAIGASVDRNAVSNTTGTPTKGNELDEIEVVGQQVKAGRTMGPDLVSARTVVIGDPTFGTERTVAIYVFDEVVDADQLVAGRFWIYDPDGNPFRASSVTQGDAPNEVQASFSSSEVVRQAVAATVNDGAVQDAESNDNPEGYARLDAQQ